MIVEGAGHGGNGNAELLRYLFYSGQFFLHDAENKALICLKKLKRLRLIHRLAGRYGSDGRK